MRNGVDNMETLLLKIAILSSLFEKVNNTEGDTVTLSKDGIRYLLLAELQDTKLLIELLGEKS